ncbi:hypothetical protein PSTG_00006 [Puccinia striiformis f. sp. tritici PST-78]|uniref:HAT C-terminal dimerisation domain-containing protein n=1 Tax=Puccinia striiformis f. sp. tritici PST-78 TaxID=1165861 RepID=A0A0L0W5Z9_9BASI|nr:hypothetical protein PSTG_00006 [Puccinia striiformis f. sp. tritici PST-78]
MLVVPDTVDPTSADGLSIYLSGKYKWPKENADDPLTWWKAHTCEFLVLSLLARDYLACCATSASGNGASLLWGTPVDPTEEVWIHG